MVLASSREGQGTHIRFVFYASTDQRYDHGSKFNLRFYVTAYDNFHNARSSATVLRTGSSNVVPRVHYRLLTQLRCEFLNAGTSYDNSRLVYASLGVYFPTVVRLVWSTCTFVSLHIIR